MVGKWVEVGKLRGGVVGWWGEVEMRRGGGEVGKWTEVRIES